MSDYNLTMEQLEAAKAAKSPEELVAKAKEQGIDITLEQAAAFLNPEAAKTEELADEELDNVAGGGCGDPSEQELKWAGEAKADGRPVKVTKDLARDTCPNCGALASVYAVWKKETMKYSMQKHQHYIFTEFFDCKCYACKSQFSVLEK